MCRCIRRFILCAALLTGLGIITPAAVRADDPPNMQDYNTYWQVATDPAPPDPRLDYNTYWAEVQAKQEWQNRQESVSPNP
ncbi:MAG TPA: hypothetical protein VGY66_14085 [Gemmataceae bacterium]|jgi:hypothetical protein|nr:hypothetical protein [Gemmataceae bacterium]